MPSPNATRAEHLHETLSTLLRRSQLPIHGDALYKNALSAALDSCINAHHGAHGDHVNRRVADAYRRLVAARGTDAPSLALILKEAERLSAEHYAQIQPIHADIPAHLQEQGKGHEKEAWLREQADRRRWSMRIPAEIARWRTQVETLCQQTAPEQAVVPPVVQQFLPRSHSPRAGQNRHPSLETLEDRLVPSSSSLTPVQQEIYDDIAASHAAAVSVLDAQELTTEQELAVLAVQQEMLGTQLTTLDASADTLQAAMELDNLAESLSDAPAVVTPEWQTNSRTQLPGIEGVALTPFQRFAVSPNGIQLLAVRNDGYVAILDIQTGQEIRSISTGIMGATSIEWSSDGEKFVISGYQGNNWKVQVRNTASGNTLWERSFGNSGAMDAHWNGDGSRIIVALSDNNQTQSVILNATTGQNVLQLNTQKVTTSAFSANGTEVYAGMDGNVSAYDAQTGVLLRTYGGVGGRISAIAASADGKYLVIGGAEGQVNVYDAKMGTQIAAVTGKGGFVSSIQWNDVGTVFAVGRGMSTNATTGATLYTVTNGTVQTLQFVQLPAGTEGVSVAFGVGGQTLFVRDSKWIDGTAKYYSTLSAVAVDEHAWPTTLPPTITLSADTIAVLSAHGLSTTPSSRAELVQLRDALMDTVPDGQTTATEIAVARAEIIQSIADVEVQQQQKQESLHTLEQQEADLDAYFAEYGAQMALVLSNEEEDASAIHLQEMADGTQQADTALLAAQDVLWSALQTGADVSAATDALVQSINQRVAVYGSLTPLTLASPAPDGVDLLGLTGARGAEALQSALLSGASTLPDSVFRTSIAILSAATADGPWDAMDLWQERVAGLTAAGNTAEAAIAQTALDALIAKLSITEITLITLKLHMDQGRPVFETHAFYADHTIVLAQGWDHTKPLSPPLALPRDGIVTIPLDIRGWGGRIDVMILDATGKPIGFPPYYIVQKSDGSFAYGNALQKFNNDERAVTTRLLERPSEQQALLNTLTPEALQLAREFQQTYRLQGLTSQTMNETGNGEVRFGSISLNRVVEIRKNGDVYDHTEKRIVTTLDPLFFAHPELLETLVPGGDISAIAAEHGYELHETYVASILASELGAVGLQGNVFVNADGDEVARLIVQGGMGHLKHLDWSYLGDLSAAALADIDAYLETGRTVTELAASGSLLPERRAFIAESTVLQAAAFATEYGLELKGGSVHEGKLGYGEESAWSSVLNTWLVWKDGNVMTEREFVQSMQDASYQPQILASFSSGLGGMGYLVSSVERIADRDLLEALPAAARAQMIRLASGSALDLSQQDGVFVATNTLSGNAWTWDVTGNTWRAVQSVSASLLSLPVTVTERSMDWNASFQGTFSQIALMKLGITVPSVRDLAAQEHPELFGRTPDDDGEAIRRQAFKETGTWSGPAYAARYSSLLDSRKDNLQRTQQQYNKDYDRLLNALLAAYRNEEEIRAGGQGSTDWMQSVPAHLASANAIAFGMHDNFSSLYNVALDLNHSTRALQGGVDRVAEALAYQTRIVQQFEQNILYVRTHPDSLGTPFSTRVAHIVLNTDPSVLTDYFAGRTAQKPSLGILTSKLQQTFVAVYSGEPEMERRVAGIWGEEKTYVAMAGTNTDTDILIAMSGDEEKIFGVLQKESFKGDELTPMTRDSLQRIFQLAQKAKESAQARGDTRQVAQWQSLAEASAGLLSIIPQGEMVPDFSAHPNSIEWVAVVERMTTDPFTAQQVQDRIRSGIDAQRAGHIADVDLFKVTSVPDKTIAVPAGTELFQTRFELTGDSMVNLWIDDVRNMTIAVYKDGKFLFASPSQSIVSGKSISARMDKGVYDVYAIPMVAQSGLLKTSGTLHIDIDPSSNSKIEGKVSREGSTEVFDVRMTGFGGINFDPVTKQNTIISTEIQKNRHTWVVIHGRSDFETSGKFIELLDALQQYSTSAGRDMQIITIDWRDAANDITDIPILEKGDLHDARWAEAVGNWVAHQLEALGLTPDLLNFPVHSHGSYVGYFAAEALQKDFLARGFSKEQATVNSIIALDSASNLRIARGPDIHIDFTKVARSSLALVSSRYGSPFKAATAQYSLTFNGSVPEATNTDWHNMSVTALADILRENMNGSDSAIGDLLNMQSLLEGHTLPNFKRTLFSEGTITVGAQKIGSGDSAFWKTDIRGISYDDADGQKKWISDFGNFTGSRMEKLVSPPPEIDNVALQFTTVTAKKMRVTVILDTIYNQLPGTTNNNPIVMGLDTDTSSTQFNILPNQTFTFDYTFTPGAHTLQFLKTAGRTFKVILEPLE